MGGSLIIAAIVIPTFLWSDLTNPYVWIVLLTTLAFGVLGFWDDYKKIRDKNGIGIRARYKFPIQVVIGLVTEPRPFLRHRSRFEADLSLLQEGDARPGGLVHPLFVLVIVGSANAVNLTDGLDGLAIGPVLIASATFMLFCYLAGNFRFAGYLQIPFVKGSRRIDDPLRGPRRIGPRLSLV